MANSSEERDLDVFYFFFGEGPNRIERKMKRSQITAQRLASMFEINADGLHVVEEFGNLAEWPNREGRFDLSAFARGSYLQVKGKKSGALQGFVQPTSNPGSSGFSQLFRSAIPGKKKTASYSLKVTRAEREGMKIINPSRQTYINVTDSTACVPFIVAQCREDFDDHSLELVTANGLAIEDSESTKGLTFWKANSRKLFAVSTICKQERKRRKAAAYDEIVSIDDDSDGVSTKSSNMSLTLPSDYADTLKQLLADQTQSFVDMIENVVQKAMADAMQPNYFIVRAVQNSLIQDLLASFHCIICQNVAQPAVIYGRCCGSVLGCQPCIEAWFQGHTNCPKCREEDGQSKTSVLRGFDDALANATTRFQRN